MINTFKRIFKSGLLSFFRDGHLTLATIFILAMTIFLVSSLFVMKDAGNFIVGSLKEKVDISAYFKEDSLEVDILRAQDAVSKLPEVEEVEYVSKEQALEEFIARHSDDPNLMESLKEVGANPFLASLNIRAQQASQYEAISKFLDNSEFKSLIAKIDYYQRKSVIERIFNLVSVFEKSILGLSIILAIIAILVTFNTVRLAIYSQREEIKIQKLVGASSQFVRGPFVVQGLISGISAAIICLGFFWAFCWFLGPRIEFFFSGLNIYDIFIVNLRTLILIQLATGISLGMVSSTFATRRYLKA